MYFFVTITPIILQAGRDKLYLIKRIKQGMGIQVDANGLDWSYNLTPYANHLERVLSSS